MGGEQGDTARMHEDLIVDVQAVLTDDLLLQAGVPRTHRLAGHCYAASEAVFCVLGGLDAGHSMTQVRHEGVSHWFVRLSDGTVVDPTAEQFETPVPYERGRANNGFVRQHDPSAPAQEILARIRQVPLFGEEPSDEG